VTHLIEQVEKGKADSTAIVKVGNGEVKASTLEMEH